MKPLYDAFIFARGGSKGLPGKNIKPLFGKPLIAWSIEQAKQVERIQNVFVSTDCPHIAKVAQQYGAEVPFMRPSELAQDNSSEWLAWQHALNFLKEKKALPKGLVSIPCTAPLRSVSDIERCLDEYEKNLFDVVVTMSAAHRNPWFNMLKKADHSEQYELVNKPEKPLHRRQDAPEVFDMTTVAYIANPEFVLTHNSLFEGKIGGIEIPVERAIDIDTLGDFELAEYYLNKKHKTS